MRASVRSFVITDVGQSELPEFDPWNFALEVRVMVGPVGEVGEDSFDVTVCTGTWLAEQAKNEGPLIGRHYLVVQEYNLVEVKKFLKRQIEVLEAESWDELAVRIGRLARWEFEDYSP